MQLTYAETERYSYLSGNFATAQLATEADELQSEIDGFDDERKEARQEGYSDALTEFVGADALEREKELNDRLAALKDENEKMGETLKTVYKALTDGTLKLAPDRKAYAARLREHLRRFSIWV